MADAIGIRVEGVDDVVRDMGQIAEEIEDPREALDEIATEAAERLRRRIPRKSGRAAATARGGRSKGKAYVQAGSEAVPYLGPLNYGWPARNIEPVGFMQDTDRELEPLAVDRIDQHIDRTIRQRGMNR